MTANSRAIRLHRTPDSTSGIMCGMDETRGSRGACAPRLLSARVAGMAAMLGGLLWVTYGLFTMLQPWGVEVVYREAQGYSVVVDKTLFVAYSVPGSLALVLASIGLLGVVETLSRRRAAVAQATCALGYVALALGSASLLGVIALFDPVFTAGRIFGTLALGVATTMAAVVAQQANVDRVWVIALLLLGALGVFLLPLWPLVYALQWVTAGQGAWVIALFGVGWLAVGYRLLREANHPGLGRHRYDRERLDRPTP